MDLTLVRVLFYKYVFSEYVPNLSDCSSQISRAYAFFQYIYTATDTGDGLPSHSDRFEMIRYLIEAYPGSVNTAGNCWYRGV